MPTNAWDLPSGTAFRLVSEFPALPAGLDLAAPAGLVAGSAFCAFLWAFFAGSAAVSAFCVLPWSFFAGLGGIYFVLAPARSSCVPILGLRPSRSWKKPSSVMVRRFFSLMVSSFLGPH